jgi:purine nucleoside permease
MVLRDAPSNAMTTGSRTIGWLFAAPLAGCATPLSKTAEPIKVKVFVAAMFEIGQNTSDRAGEFQHWYERYWMTSPALPVHLDPAPGQTAGGFAETVLNVERVGARVVDHIVADWPQWQGGVPALPK